MKKLPELALILACAAVLAAIASRLIVRIVWMF